MNSNVFRPIQFALGALFLVALALCFTLGATDAAQTYEGSISSDELLGKWQWAQRGHEEFQGVFVLKNGLNGSIDGTIDDIREGTYGDLIQGFEFKHNKFSLTRNGRFGLQEWTGIVSRTPEGLRLEGSFIKRSSTEHDWRGPWPLVAELRK